MINGVYSWQETPLFICFAVSLILSVTWMKNIQSYQFCSINWVESLPFSFFFLPPPLSLALYLAVLSSPQSFSRRLVWYGEAGFSRIWHKASSIFTRKKKKKRKKESCGPGLFETREGKVSHLLLPRQFQDLERKEINTSANPRNEGGTKSIFCNTLVL